MCELKTELAAYRCSCIPRFCRRLLVVALAYPVSSRRLLGRRLLLCLNML